MKLTIKSAIKGKRARSKKVEITLRSREAAHNVRLHKLVSGNPRREGSHGFKSFSIIKEGMTYDQYISKGGRNRDLSWDVAKGFVTLEEVK